MKLDISLSLQHLSLSPPSPNLSRTRPILTPARPGGNTDHARHTTTAGPSRRFCREGQQIGLDGRSARIYFPCLWTGVDARRVAPAPGKADEFHLFTFRIVGVKRVPFFSRRRVTCRSWITVLFTRCSPPTACRLPRTACCRSDPGSRKVKPPHTRSLGLNPLAPSDWSTRGKCRFGEFQVRGGVLYDTRPAGQHISCYPNPLVSEASGAEVHRIRWRPENARAIRRASRARWPRTNQPAMQR